MSTNIRRSSEKCRWSTAVVILELLQCPRRLTQMELSHYGATDSRVLVGPKCQSIVRSQESKAVGPQLDPGREQQFGIIGNIRALHGMISNDEKNQSDTPPTELERMPRLANLTCNHKSSSPYWGYRASPWQERILCLQWPRNRAAITMHK